MDQDIEITPTTCPECGAPTVDGMTCWEQLGMIIAWELEDPEHYAEHFLTVTSYNLQHPAQFTDEALTWLRTSLIERLGHGTQAEELRRRAAIAYGGKQRVLRDESARKPVLRAWRMTIADVYIPGKPEDTVARIRAWAASIREEL